MTGWPAPAMAQDECRSLFRWFADKANSRQHVRDALSVSLAKQGHRYRLGGIDVLALESGAGRVSVAKIDESRPWPLGTPFEAEAAGLTPLPMRYFGGEIPA